ncbi:MAG: hypothetical protein JRJ57_08100, partial [Deltaproteobacteria bacterium]|nr:hypothetical protein [Deltaproteobacteria bacterium]
LRELRPVWEKCDPDPLPVVQEMAERFKIDIGQYNRKSAGRKAGRHQILLTGAWWKRFHNGELDVKQSLRGC